MALVQIRQSFVMEGYSEIRKRKHWWNKYEYERTLIICLTGICVICEIPNEKDIHKIVEQKIQEEMQQSSGWGRNFEGWSSYRKYYKTGESYEYPDGKELELSIEYVRDWKMEKILKELDGNQFAALCKELGISAGEAIIRP